MRYVVTVREERVYVVEAANPDEVRAVFDDRLLDSRGDLIVRRDELESIKHA